MNNPFDVIEARLNTIETLLLDIKHQPERQIDKEKGDVWFNIDQLCNYLPDKPKKATVYGWINAGLIPCHKGPKKLRFLKSEIDQWLATGKKKTWSEIAVEADNYLQSRERK